MKKIILKIAFLLATIFVSCNQVFAYTSNLAASKSTVNPGNTFTIKINLSGLDNGLGSAEYTLGFDSSLFEVSSVSTKATYNTLSSSVKFTFVDMTGSNPMTNGTFATVTFKAKSVTSDKTGSFTLSSKETSDQALNNISSTNSGTSVKIHILDTDNTLKDLTINGTTISGFNKDTLTYNVTNESSSIKIGATATSSAASISGTGTKTVNYGSNTYSVVVTSESGSKKTYKINVTRPDNRDTVNTLDSLAVKGYTISPTFAKNTTSYTLNVESSVTSITVNATKTSSKSSFESGYAPRTVKLSYGKNTVNIKVKSENEKVKTYTITVNRKDDRSVNNYLKTLTVSEGKINFNKTTTTYALVTQASSITIAAEAEDSKATVSGAKTYNLKDGLNEIKIVVTAENESTKTYLIKVTKTTELEQVKVNNNLKELNVENYNLTFNPETTDYKIKINDETSLNINYAAEDENAIVDVIGNENLKNGSVVTIRLTGLDGSTKEYKINIEKEEIVEIEEEKSKNNNNILIYILLGVSILLNGVLTFLLIKSKSKKKIK